MVKHVVLLVALAGCGSKNSVAECDSYIATMEKIASCSKIPAETRQRLAALVKEMRGKLAELDLDHNGSQDVVKLLRRTCVESEQYVIAGYKDVLPDCVK
jgi:hypothetical protein